MGDEMGIILEFRRISADADDNAEESLFRERRVPAGTSSDVIIFPGVRIERVVEDNVLLDAIQSGQAPLGDGSGRKKSN